MSPSKKTEGSDVTTELVVPFSVTREHAQQLLRDYLRRRRRLFKVFAPQVENLQEAYVPCFACDVFAFGEVGCVGTKEVLVSKMTTTLHYAMRIHGCGEFSGILVKGTTRIPDDVMVRLAPFSLGAAQAFEDECMADGLVEECDVAPHIATDTARRLALASFKLAARDELIKDFRTITIPAKAETHEARETFDRGIETFVLESKVVALPVWFFRCEHEGQSCLFVVNGQTGACADHLPYSLRHYEDDDQWKTIITMILVVCVAAFSMYLVCSGKGPSLLAITTAVASAYVLWNQSRALKQELRVAKEASERAAKRTPGLGGEQMGQEVLFDSHRVLYAKSEGEAVALVAEPPRLRDRRQAAMWDYARAACDEFHQHAQAAGSAITRKRGLPNYTFVPFDEDLLLVHDDALTADGAYGYAISDAGLWCRPKEGDGKSWFTSWEELSAVTSLGARSLSPGAPPCLCVDGEWPVSCLEGDEPLREELVRLYKRLCDKARQVFA